MAERPLLRNVLTLSASSLVVRVMGFAYRVLLVRMAGAEVVGVFQMSAPLLRLCATVVSLGLPVALSKTIAESLAKRDVARVRNSFRVSFLFVPHQLPRGDGSSTPLGRFSVRASLAG